MPRERADEGECGTAQNRLSAVSGVEGWPAAPGMRGGVRELLGIMFARAAAGAAAGTGAVTGGGRDPSWPDDGAAAWRRRGIEGVSSSGTSSTVGRLKVPLTVTAGGAAGAGAAAGTAGVDATMGAAGTDAAAGAAGAGTAAGAARAAAVTGGCSD